MAIRIKTVFAAALAVFMFSGTILAQPANSPVARNGQLSVKNARIVNKDGEPVALRGMSFYWDNPGWNGHQFYTAATVNKLADEWKVDIIRAAFSGPNGQTSKIKTVVDAAIAKGIYVILDYHSHNANNELSTAQSFFNTFLNDASYVGKPNILYEIFNEPDGKDCANSSQVWNSSGFMTCINNFWNQNVRGYSNTMVQHIRAKDPNNIILIGTPFFCLRPDVASNNPVNGTNLAYVFHFYAAEATHGTDKFAAITTTINNGHAVYVSEFGVTEADGSGTVSTTKTETWFKLLDQYSIGWCNWSMSSFEESSVLSGGQPDGSGWVTRSPGGTFIRQELINYGTLTYTAAVSSQGEGQTKSMPAGPNFRRGTPVTFTATPASGWSFAGWQGAGVTSSTASSVSFTTSPLYANAPAVTAVFEQDGNMLKNGTFTLNSQPWASGGTGSAMERTDNGELRLSATGAGTVPNDLRLNQNGIEIKKGGEYRLTFSAYGQSARPLTVRITNGGRSAEAAAPYEVQLTNSKQKYTYNFKSTIELPATGSAANVGSVLFAYGGSATTWFIDDVRLECTGKCEGDNSPVISRPAAGGRAAWTVSRTAGGLQLRGPADAGAKVLLYDVRGKLVKTMQAVDGLTVGAGLGAGNYFMVVKNGAGSEMLTARVPLVR
ncbi:MAG: cellulase family glycosylhydrolase [Chitinispirillia bacterium]|nr:cellulase family glycosylhydrolase [Chitinispirillia bacterium]MCL2241743.1 cellulase family glycosylhydrolase [Chitinispirillia bacterium]